MLNSNHGATKPPIERARARAARISSAAPVGAFRERQPSALSCTPSSRGETLFTISGMRAFLWKSIGAKITTAMFSNGTSTQVSSTSSPRTKKGALPPSPLSRLLPSRRPCSDGSGEMRDDGSDAPCVIACTHRQPSPVQPAARFRGPASRRETAAGRPARSLSPRSGGWPKPRASKVPGIYVLTAAGGDARRGWRWPRGCFWVRRFLYGC